jgi:hypothetical protein
MGNEAEVLLWLCESILQARDADALRTEQDFRYAQACEALLRAFGKVGIIALIDEASGYQADRDRDELQKILAAYISKELMPWTSRFPEEFFLHMFRLRGWQYHRLSSGKGSPKGPRYAGKLTDELIYRKLPPVVREELRKKCPHQRKIPTEGQTLWLPN